MGAVDPNAAAEALLSLLETALGEPLVVVLLLILAPLVGIVGWRILRAAVTMLSWLILAGIAAAAVIVLGAGVP